MIGKLMGLATIGSTWANVAVLNRFLSNVAKVIALSVVSALFCCFLILGLFYAIYAGLIHYGLDPFVSTIIVASLIAVLTAALVAMTVVKVRQLRNLSKQHIYGDTLGLTHMGSVIEAFLHGLTGHRPPRN